MNFNAIPIEAPLSGATVQLNIVAESQDWNLNLLIVRKGSQLAIDASELTVSAVDASGFPLSLKEAPSGPLTEAGGSLQSTASVMYRFAGSLPPQEVEVHWEGDLARFHIVQRP
jgi:hypothetical protein